MKYSCYGCKHAPYKRDYPCTTCGKYVLAEDGESTVYVYNNWTPEENSKLDKQQEIMRDTIKLINVSRTYTLDTDKIKTLEDVKNVLEGLDIQITLREGTTSNKYEKLKDYLK